MLKSFVGRCVCVVWETRWDDNAQLPTLPPLLQVHPRARWLKAISAQGHFGSRLLWRTASLAQGHQMVALVVVMAMVALMVIVMNDVGAGDDGDDEHGGRH